MNIHVLSSHGCDLWPPARRSRQSRTCALMRMTRKYWKRDWRASRVHIRLDFIYTLNSAETRTWTRTWTWTWTRTEETWSSDQHLDLNMKKKKKKKPESRERFNPSLLLWKIFTCFLCLCGGFIIKDAEKNVSNVIKTLLQLWSWWFHTFTHILQEVRLSNNKPEDQHLQLVSSNVTQVGPFLCFMFVYLAYFI